MKLLFTVILIIPEFLFAQTVLDKIKMSEEIAGFGNVICEQIYRSLGSIKENQKTYELYEVLTDFGPSCKRNTKLVITASNKLIGYYITLGIIPEIKPDGRIQWNFEDGSKKYSRITKMDFMNYEILPGIVFEYRSVNK